MKDSETKFGVAETFMKDSETDFAITQAWNCGNSTISAQDAGQGLDL